MQESGIIGITTVLVVKDFGLDEKEIKPVDNFDDLKDQLTKIIRFLLDKDFAKLINACYRIDIAEAKLKEVLHYSAPDQIASNLATLIIDREHQKALLRQKYSSY